MRRIGSLLVVFALSSMAGCGKSHVVPPLTWETDHVAALARSAREDRPLFVFVGAEWDTGAKELERVTFADARVRNELRRFVNLYVDMTDDELPSTQSTTLRFKIIGEPALVVLAPDGETELVRIHQFVLTSSDHRSRFGAGELPKPKRIRARERRLEYGEEVVG